MRLADLQLAMQSHVLRDTALAASLVHGTREFDIATRLRVYSNGFRSRLIDAPPHNLSFKDIEEDVKAHELIVIHTSTPSFKSDCKSARLVRAINPTAKIGFIGAKVAVEPVESMQALGLLD